MSDGGHQGVDSRAPTTDPLSTERLNSALSFALVACTLYNYSKGYDMEHVWEAGKQRTGKPEAPQKGSHGTRQQKSHQRATGATDMEPANPHRGPEGMPGATEEEPQEPQKGGTGSPKGTQKQERHWSPREPHERHRSHRQGTHKAHRGSESMPRATKKEPQEPQTGGTGSAKGIHNHERPQRPPRQKRSNQSDCPQNL